MNQATIDRYQMGGDIWLQNAADYGLTAANTIADAALTGDATAVNAAIVQAKFGSPLNDSTASIFGQQIVDNPLAAPAESLNNQLGKAFGNLVKNPFVLITTLLLLAGAFVYFFGNPFKKHA